VQDRPSRQRNLVPTTGTLPALELHQSISTPPSTARTHEAHPATADGEILWQASSLRIAAETRARSLETAVEPFPYTTAGGLLKQPDKQEAACARPQDVADLENCRRSSQRQGFAADQMQPGPADAAAKVDRHKNPPRGDVFSGHNEPGGTPAAVRRGNKGMVADGFEQGMGARNGQVGKR